MGKFNNSINLLKNSVQFLYQQRGLHTARGMACSRFEYVKNYEQDDSILPNVWIVIRLDGKGFHTFCKAHNFAKPNDANALNLMNTAAVSVMEEFRDITLAYGQSDEYSFVFRKETNVFNRRAAKLLSYVTSLFTSAYVFNWSRWMSSKSLLYPPCFDGRIVLYPSDQNLRDYLSWRQADVHINNLYNTAFWNLVLESGLSNQEAEAELRGTFSADKNEMLFTKFGINYNNLPVMFRKGTVLLRKRVKTEGDGGLNRQLIVPHHDDMIREKFWKDHSELLGKYKPGDYVCAAEDIPPVLLSQIEKLNLDEDKGKVGENYS
ncbi:PREDICTED: probable tRNA(His) guanylyltransferase [Rhagoletis zephyria]|uniref:probable tRNA(His) guanylyltransferase n=1 Tax=Rhagoletis zephyria TaxID=28612 RepID=UPI00081187A1|nr:PREDICTED: probable tRNA(His) guanylyltransferase [Rhagoletis zephyria]XP_017474904.1 PREDICTED: probable tRNA(His) guanylyltransferase [Rhagoletis zephyria]